MAVSDNIWYLYTQKIKKKTFFLKLHFTNYESLKGYNNNSLIKMSKNGLVLGLHKNCLVLNTYYNYLSDGAHSQNNRHEPSTTQPSSIINMFYLCEWILKADVV